MHSLLAARAARIGTAIALAAALGLTPPGPDRAPAAESAGWVSAGLEGAPVSRLAVDTANPGSMYVGLEGVPAGRGSVRRTLDGGKTWISLERGLPPGLEPTALATSPDEARVVLVASTGGLFRSASGGATWSEVRQPLPPVTTLLFDRANPRIVLAGTELRGNFRSVDAGLTWRPASAGLPRDRYGATPGAVQLVQHPSDPKVLYMGANGFDGVYRSDDAGRTWRAAAAGLPSPIVLGLAVQPLADDRVLALTEKGLAISNDRGASWQASGNLPVPDPAGVQFEPGAKDTLYLASVRGTLFRSTNGGRTWASLPALPRPVRLLSAWPGTPAAAAPAPVATPATGAGAGAAPPPAATPSVPPGPAVPVLAAGAGEGLFQLSLFPTLPASPEPAANNRRFFPETSHNVSPTFYPFYLARGGLERFGFPRTEELEENGRLVQYFQRARLEYHADRRNTPYEVQISLLGEWLVPPASQPRVEPFESSTDFRYFEETGHSVTFAFLRHWNTRNGLDSFGFPISEELVENGRPVQYFQRGRMEYRQEAAGTRDEVQPGSVGDEVLRLRGWLD
jgi:photosystem II stability/assembly factor-like uncharacterized protein